VSPGRDRIALWQAAGPTPPRRDLSGPVGDVAAVRFSPDGKILAATGSRGTVLWDIASGRVVRSVPGLGGEPALAFAPRGDTLVVAQSDGSVVDLDLRTGAEVTGRSTGASVDALDVSPDGKLIASAALDGTATLWQTSGLDVLSQLSGAVADYSLGFSPDGKLVAVGDSSGTVTLWDVKTRTPVGRLRTGQNGGVLSLAFDRTGHELVTTGGGQVRLWDVASRKLIGAPLPGSPGGGNAVFFTDGKHILATFSSGTGTVWDVNPTDWGTFACRIAHRNLTPAEWKDLLPGRPYRPVCR
jgi:WD40 repeat protein